MLGHPLSPPRHPLGPSLHPVLVRHHLRDVGRALADIRGHPGPERAGFSRLLAASVREAIAAAASVVRAPRRAVELRDAAAAIAGAVDQRAPEPPANAAPGQPRGREFERVVEGGFLERQSIPDSQATLIGVQFVLKLAMLLTGRRVVPPDPAAGTAWQVESPLADQPVNVERLASLHGRSPSSSAAAAAAHAIAPDLPKSSNGEALDYTSQEQSPATRCAAGSLNAP